MIVDESLVNECGTASRARWCGSSTSRSRSQPMVVSNYTVPEASGDFCERGGRFGAHSSNESMAPVFYGKLAFVDLLQCRRARDRHPQSVPAEGGRLLHPGDHRGDRQALRQGRRQGALQDRDPEQQRRDRRPRLHLCGRPRQHGPAHPRADAGGRGSGRGGSRHRQDGLDPALDAGNLLAFPAMGFGRPGWLQPNPTSHSRRREIT